MYTEIGSVRQAVYKSSYVSYQTVTLNSSVFNVDARLHNSDSVVIVTCWLRGFKLILLIYIWIVILHLLVFKKF